MSNSREGDSRVVSAHCHLHLSSLYDAMNAIVPVAFCHHASDITRLTRDDSHGDVARGEGCQIGYRLDGAHANKQLPHEDDRSADH